MPAGRPSRYSPDFARQARAFCRLGADVADLARLFSVSVATIYRWQQQYHDFALAYAIGRAEAEGIARPGSFKRATGYEYWAERQYRVKDGGTLGVDTLRRTHADPRVGMRWLRNRKPDQWRPGARAGRAQDRDPASE
jgi:hypothetical protein